jgi:hypothetical protein
MGGRVGVDGLAADGLEAPRLRDESNDLPCH